LILEGWVNKFRKKFGADRGNTQKKERETQAE
jgi:hypothetical protein